MNGQVSIDQKNFGGYGGLIIKGDAPGSNYPNLAFSTSSFDYGDVVGAMIQGNITDNAADEEAMDLNFMTTNSGSPGLKNRMTIKDNGNVGIGTSAPATSALLELNNTAKGFLPPRLTTAQRNAIVAPPTGLTIYNTGNRTLESFDGTVWAPSASVAYYIGESYGGVIVFYVYDNGSMA